MKNLCVALLLLLPFSAANAGDATAGKTKAASCFACHGADGIGIAETYPNLAGQKQGYLVSSIKAYKDGQRAGGLAVLMTPMVATLTDEDMADIAAYYSSLGK